MENIDEDKKTIGEFMDLYKCKYGTIVSKTNPKFCKPSWNSLKYDTSWNDLMPVVEKIESLNIEYKGSMISFDVVIVYGDCIVRDDVGRGFEISKHSIDSSSKISAVYDAIVEFIKWYNENK